MSAQKKFATALLAPEISIPENIRPSRKGTPPLKRFIVYRSNVLSSLITLLGELFPIISRLVGEDFFHAMAQRYIQCDPPRSPVLLEYGESFPSFIDTFPQIEDFPYLGDVARLERARHNAYHAADVEPLSMETLAQALEKHSLTDCAVAFHPSASILASPYPIMRIWEMNQNDASVSPLEKWDAETVLIWRRDYFTKAKVLLSQDAVFIEALFRKTKLGDALEIATGDSRFNPDDVIAFLISEGLLSQILPQ